MSENITINGNDYDPEVVSAGVNLFRESMAQNARGINPTSGSIGGADVSSDATISRWLGKQYNGDRDVHKVLGYPDLDDDTALERYRARYEYQDVASRIIDVFPEETWKNPPKVVDETDGEDDTEFETTVNRLLESELTAYFRRLDRAQRLGEYGVMVIGFADGQPLEEPVNESAINSLDDISHYNIFTQENVEDWKLGKHTDGEHSDPANERYNKPVEYRIDFGDVDAEAQDDDFKQVHWSRVIHVAEGALETDLKGEPALKKIFYRLIDREKVVGASAEMFWSGADEKIIANVKEDFALQQYDDTGQREDFKAQLESLLHDMQKYIVSSGMEYEVIGGQEVDPSGVVDVIDTAIATAVGMPKNKLRGNETGERSTTQDRNNWFDTISTRQTNFAGPKIARQTIDRFVQFGVIPGPDGSDYALKFPSLFEQDDGEIADTQSTRANMLQASGLAMTLTSEQKVQWIQEGPEAVDMEDTQEVPVDPAGETAGQIEAFHELYTDVDNQDVTPPQQAQTNAEAVLRVRDKTDAMTETGWRRARQLANGGELSEDVIQRMAQFKRHQSNTEYDNFSDIPQSKKSEDADNPWWDDNGTVAWLGWGGTAGVEWAGEQSEEMSENEDTTWWRIWE